MSLTKEDIADALDCFWNASLGHAINVQDSTAIAVAGSLSEGFSAIARRLREQSEIDPRDARIADLERQIAALPSRERILEYQAAAIAMKYERDDDSIAAFDRLSPLIHEKG